MLVKNVYVFSSVHFLKVWFFSLKEQGVEEDSESENSIQDSDEDSSP